MAATLLVLIPAIADAARTKLIGRTFILHQANETPRLTVRCPKAKRFHFPYGGGMFSTSPYEIDGEGVYPHSYERLGVQHGFHVTPVLYDRSASSTRPHQVTLQVICGPEPGKLSPKHTTEFLSPGTSKTLDATCAGKRKLIGGGFQRTDFTAKGGDFVTESYAVTPNVWRVSGAAFGTFGGELTGIAYCRRKGGMVSTAASAEVAPHALGSATPPPCPGKKVMTWTGFQTNPKGAIFYAGSAFDDVKTLTGFGFNITDRPATLTVYGYCNRVRTIRKHH